MYSRIRRFDRAYSAQYKVAVPGVVEVEDQQREMGVSGMRSNASERSERRSWEEIKGIRKTEYRMTRVKRAVSV